METYRNLSLLGKIAVVKSLLLPQLLYLFSVLCIDLPKSFFKRLDSLLFKFIWNHRNDRVKRDIICNDFEDGGLRMINPLVYAQAQRMSWVAKILE